MAQQENTIVSLDDNMRAQLKVKQMELLKMFLAVCDKHGLLYFAVGGTALGAVRHGGYIPWDDDIDVALPRPDYQRFLEVAQQELPAGYFLQTHKTDPEYRNDFAKIRNSNTTFMEMTSSLLRIDHGIYIDIFPIDGYPENKLAARILEIKKKLLKLYVAKDYIYPDKNMLRSVIQFFAKCALYGVPTAEVVNRAERMYMKYPYETCDTVVCHGGAWKEREICPKAQYGKGVTGYFEGMEVRLPEKTHEYLTHKYNNYMQLPPPEKQVAHHYCKKINFEHSSRGGKE